MSAIRKRLAAVYARIPEVRCQGKCQEACGPIACTDGERELMERRSGRPLTFSATDGRCTYLNDAGRCDVYRDRPLVCRMLGASTKLPCIWGCVPDRVLSYAEENALYLRVAEDCGGAVRDEGREARVAAGRLGGI